MSPYAASLGWIESQHEAMLTRTIHWANINSGSTHLEGLARMCAALEQAFAPLGGEMEQVELASRLVIDSSGLPQHMPVGNALRIRKRPEAPLRVFLGGHMDTVYAADHPFQHTHMLDNQTLGGPGVADLKGGLSVMLTVLQALEQSEDADNIGWEVLVNPDEEIGSAGSMPLLAEAASRNHLGLVFEPALMDGTLAGVRKGSGNFTAVMRGKAAHAGRDFKQGKNAVAALAEFITALYHMNGHREGVTVNPAKLEGGGPLNQVPDLAICRFNVRVGDEKEQAWVEEQLATQLSIFQEREGYWLDIYGGFGRPAKRLSDENLLLFTMLKDCGAKLDIPVSWKPTGGCCDGNNLAAFGLPNVDSLGVRGGNLHTPEEYMIIESLVERAKLSALLLLRLASGELTWARAKAGGV